MAPEFRKGWITFESDIFSLGVIIQQILTGKKGFLLVEKNNKLSLEKVWYY